jgi:hypothetical protein
MVGLMRLLLQYGDEIAELKSRIQVLERLAVKDPPT